MAIKTFEARAKVAFAALVKGGAGMVELANLALEYAAPEGDFRKAHWLYVNMPRQGCPELFLAWLRAFSPVQHNRKDGNSVSFSKNKADDAQAFDIEGAAKVSYFDYAKAAPAEKPLLLAKDFDLAVERFIKTWTTNADNGKVEAESLVAVRNRLAGVKALVDNNFRVVQPVKPVELEAIAPAAQAIAA